MDPARTELLLSYLRAIRRDAHASFREPPSQLTGGYDTRTFRVT